MQNINYQCSCCSSPLKPSTSEYHTSAMEKVNLLMGGLKMGDLLLTIAGKSPEENRRVVLWLNIKGYLWF